MPNIISPKHPQWNEFCNRLSGPEGCDFREEGDGDKTWRCAGGMNKDYAKAILEDLGGFDIQATFAFFDSKGGHCDCEILFNIDPATRTG